MGPKWIGEINGSHLFWVGFVHDGWVFQKQSHIHNSKRKTTQKRRKKSNEKKKKKMMMIRTLIVPFCCCWCCVEVRASHLSLKKWSKMRLVCSDIIQSCKIPHLIRIMSKKIDNTKEQWNLCGTYVACFQTHVPIKFPMCSSTCSQYSFLTLSHNPFALSSTLGNNLYNN